MKIPELWKGAPAFPTVFETINKFFGRTQRVVAIVVRSERHTPAVPNGDGEAAGSSSLLILRRNENSEFLTPEVRAALDRIWNNRARARGVPVAALAQVLSQLNEARRNFLRAPDPIGDFQAVRNEIISQIRMALSDIAC